MDERESEEPERDLEKEIEGIRNAVESVKAMVLFVMWLTGTMLFVDAMGIDYFSAAVYSIGLTSAITLVLSLIERGRS